ncbi:hypothetical protein [Maridesulfovibrio hydrothermalis]|uniref:Uncharacterized protein n=1 Tax=Maridesulfovibrio hydrothermalis AM13 = DSM 14728 TaxID=1121451 RepID=L0REY5_9BACT|nr:hypothetical protein [Maridesulfovibrio hydrothermalis]CCO24116.1 protein of unknown function [Maridesulfovibrio hydrothermalis AM13 = DSM 14728]
MLKNMFKHFFVSFVAITYLGATPILFYQYMGMSRSWPGVFIRTIYDHAGDWWLDVNWFSPVIGIILLVNAALAATYAMKKRCDHLGYRESRVESKAGF